ncbi:MAG TPA: hypothetical protein VGP68_00810, partial [Gemmataceae bacterium]|nr:hypothetical protein [Gemmataceae bacterium]
VRARRNSRLNEYMLTILRRFLAVVALMFWQGGFTFYAAVVVPIGQRVLGSHLEQGFITREVTWHLNVAGAVAMALLALELHASGYPRQLQSKLRWGIWACMAAVLLALIIAHPSLNALIDVDAHTITDRARFRSHHRMYLWISTLEWVLGGIYLWLMLRAWRTENDRK